MTWLWLGLGWFAASVVAALGLGALLRRYPPQPLEREDP